jgi:hypothetical protein
MKMNFVNFFLVSSLVVLFAFVVYGKFDPYEPQWIPFKDFDRANELAEWSSQHMEQYTGFEGKHQVMRVREALKQLDSEIYFKFTIGT